MNKNYDILFFLSSFFRKRYQHDDERIEKFLIKDMENFVEEKKKKSK
jgi:hypothetical protein